jgi:hypothetical protein
MQSFKARICWIAHFMKGQLSFHEEDMFVLQINRRYVKEHSCLHSYLLSHWGTTDQKLTEEIGLVCPKKKKKELQCIVML